MNETLESDTLTQTLTSKEGKEIVPLSDRIVVTVVAPPDKIGSFYLPPSAQEKQQRGTVRAVGPGRTENGILIPMYCQVGDEILYGKYSGTEVKVNGEALMIIRETEVLARLVDIIPDVK